MFQDWDVHKHSMIRNVSYCLNIKNVWKQTCGYYDDVFVVSTCQKDTLIIVHMLM